MMVKLGYTWVNAQQVSYLRPKSEGGQTVGTVVFVNTHSGNDGKVITHETPEEVAQILNSVLKGL